MLKISKQGVKLGKSEKGRENLKYLIDCFIINATQTLGVGMTYSVFKSPFSAFV